MGAEIIVAVLSATLGGGIAAFIRAISDNRKSKADVAVIEQKVGPEVAQLSVSTLSEVIENLRADNETLRAERDAYRESVQEFQRTIDHLRAELDRVQSELKAFLSDKK